MLLHYINSSLLTYVIILQSLAPWDQDGVFRIHSRSFEVNSVTILLTNPNQGYYCNDVKPSSCIYSRFLSVWLFARSDSSYEMKCSVSKEITQDENSGCKFKSFKKRKEKPKKTPDLPNSCTRIFTITASVPQRKSVSELVWWLNIVTDSDQTSVASRICCKW